MGMSEREFDFITPRAFYNKVKGFNQLKQVECELVRLQTVELLNIQIEGKHRIKDPKKLWRFPWEDERKKVDTERARRQAHYFMEKIKRIEQRHGDK